MGCAKGTLGDNGHFLPLQVLLLSLGLLLSPSLGCAGSCSAGEGPSPCQAGPGWAGAGDAVLGMLCWDVVLGCCAGAARAAAAQDPS